MDQVIQMTPFVDFVRNREDAQVHVLVTSETAGNVWRDVLVFIGRREMAGRADTIRNNLAMNVSTPDWRNALARDVRLGLASFAAKMGIAPDVSLRFDETPPMDVFPVADKWHHWAFSTRLHGSAMGQKSTSTSMINASVSADRTTVGSRIAFGYQMNVMNSRFEAGGAVYKARTRDVTGTYSLIRSTGEHWGAGVTGGVSTSVLQNTELRTTAMPALEYNFFPYKEFDRRSLIIQLATGIDHTRYHEETIYFKMVDALPLGRLSLQANAVEPWGSIMGSIDGSRYFDSRGKGRLSSMLFGNVRLFRGLSFNVAGMYASIHDQFSLPRSGATVEEVLLRQRQLATSFQYMVKSGFSYTFGSWRANDLNPILRAGSPGFR